MKTLYEILVVDDEEKIRKSLSGLLQDNGYRVKTAKGGHECLQMMSSHYFGLVILDIVMPEMSGIEVLEKIKEKYEDTEVIMITAYADKEKAIATFRLGAYDFIEKPFESGGILNTVTHCLKQLKQKMEIVRKNNELRESEQRFRAIFDNATDGILLADSEGKKLYNGNNRICQMLGYSIEEIRNLGIIDIHPAKDLPYVLEQVGRQLRKEITLARDIPMKRKDGKVFNADINSSPITLGGKTYLMGIFRDITERKRTEAVLWESEERYRSLVENIECGVSLISPEMKILALNKKMRDWFPNIDLSTKPKCYEAFNSPPREGICQYCPTCKTLMDGRVYEAITATSVGKKIRNYRVVSSPIRDCAGNIVAAIELVEDITERIKLEDYLRHAQKLEGIGQLAGGIAHDFNNVLNAVVGFAGLLQMKMDNADPLKHYADEIMKAGQRGAMLTHQILAFSRKQILDMKTVDLNHIIKSLKKMLLRLVREDIGIELKLFNGDVVVMADASQIDQMLINLATNARDAMPDGGRIGISTELFVMDNSFVEMHGYGSPGEYALTTVSDTGSGMDAETRARIFEPFFTTKEVGKGTGLGLAVVHGLVKQHGGYIDVYSEVGKGTIFKIYLPLTEHNAEEVEIKLATQIKDGTETILVAEDDATLRKLSATLLHSYGYTVIETVDGEDAILKFSKNKGVIKLVILDGIMPKKNGKEAFDEIRKLCPNMKAIFLSGYAEDIFTCGGIPDDSAVYIQKPVKPDDLLRKVREVLDK